LGGWGWGWNDKIRAKGIMRELALDEEGGQIEIEIQGQERGRGR